jgi:hypothetical protein
VTEFLKKHLKNAENPCSALWSKEHLLIHTMEGRANRAAKAAKEYTESGSRMARLELAQNRNRKQ